MRITIKGIDWVNKEQQIRLVALDFDLTIYDYRDPPLTLVLAEWFKRLANQQVHAGLASGRTYSDLRQTLEQIGFAWGRDFPAFVICQEGLILDPDGKEISGSEDWNRRRAERIRTANAALCPYFETSVMKAKKRGLRFIEPIVCDGCGIKVVLETPAMAEELRQNLSDATSHVEGVYVSRNHHIVLGLPYGADKGGAVAELSRLKGLEGRQVLAIGDNLNDMSMLDGRYGFQIATPANGDQQIKELVRRQAGVIASSEGPLGVVEIFSALWSVPLRSDIKEPNNNEDVKRRLVPTVASRQE